MLASNKSCAKFEARCVAMTLIASEAWASTLPRQAVAEKEELIVTNLRVNCKTMVYALAKMSVIALCNALIQMVMALLIMINSFVVFEMSLILLLKPVLILLLTNSMYLDAMLLVQLTLDVAIIPKLTLK